MRTAPHSSGLFTVLVLALAGCCGVGSAQVSNQPEVRSVRLRILDPDGGPVTFARVRVMQCHTVAHVGRVFTGAECADRVLMPSDFVNGAAVFDSLPCGAFAFVVESRPYPASQSRVFEVPGEAAEIMVRLTRGAALVGVVTDQDGRPLADAMVRTEVHPSMQEPLGFGACPVVLNTRVGVRTDREGRYRLEGIAHGEYRLHAECQDRCELRRDVSVTEDKTVVLDAFSIPRGCVVEGAATLDGVAVGGIRICLRPDDARVVVAGVEQAGAGMDVEQRLVWRDTGAVTDSTGAYRFGTNVPPGKWVMRAYASSPDADLRTTLLQMAATSTETNLIVGGGDERLTQAVHLMSKR